MHTHRKAPRLCPPIAGWRLGLTLTQPCCCCCCCCVYRIATLVSTTQVVSFYPIGLLLGWFLGFRSGYGVIGLWIGVDVGYLVMVLLLFVYMWGSVDWHEQARIAVKRSTPVAAAAHAVSDGDAEDDSADGGDLDGGAGERTRLVADEK
jgi:uncharacterized membrane protein